MKKNPFVYFDTETTGTEEEDRLCQFAAICGDLEIDELFKPPLPIKYEAMAIHHITREMVKDKPRFKGSGTFADIQILIESGRYFVAHNAKFDIKMLAKEGIYIERYIDTLKIIRHLDVDCKCVNYQMQYLRYLFGIRVKAVAHDAFGDILVLKALFGFFFDRVQKVYDLDTVEDVADKMMQISVEPELIRKFQFGKHKGELVADVAEKDIGYLRWLKKEKDKEEEPDEDWLHTLDQYL